MRPLLLRPPFLLFFSNNAANGAPLCKPSVFTETVKRRPGDVGFALCNAMIITLAYFSLCEVNYSRPKKSTSCPAANLT